jgi:hypothetical protein
MPFPSTPTQLALNQPPPPRPLYDIPPVITRPRRFGQIAWSRLLFNRARPTKPVAGSREAIVRYSGAVLACECLVRFDETESR